MSKRPNAFVEEIEARLNDWCFSEVLDTFYAAKKAYVESGYDPRLHYSYLYAFDAIYTDLKLAICSREITCDDLYQMREALTEEDLESVM